ncbi:MAG: hypothetical protein ACOCTT_03075 [archaeon]
MQKEADEKMKDLIDKKSNIKEPGLIGRTWDRMLVNTTQNIVPNIADTIGVHLRELDDINRKYNPISVISEKITGKPVDSLIVLDSEGNLKLNKDGHVDESKEIVVEGGREMEVPKENRLYEYTGKMIQNWGEEMKYFSKKMVENNPEEYQYLGEEPEGVGEYTADLLGGVLPSLGTTLTTSSIGFLTGGPAGAAKGAQLGGYGIEFGSMYDEAKEEGLSEEEARWLGRGYGAVSSTLERASAVNLFSKSGITDGITDSFLGHLKNGVLKAFRQSQIEGLTEGLQEISFNAFAKTFDEERELFENVHHSYAGGVLAGGITGFPGGLGQSVIESQETINEIQQEQFNNINELENEYRVEGDEANEMNYNPDEIENVDSLIESRNKLESVEERIAGVFDIEYQYKKAGLDELGTMAKNINQEVTAETKKGYDMLISLNQDYDLSKQDFQDLAFLTERPDTAPTELEGAVSELRNYYDENAKYLIDNKWQDQGFYGRVLDTIDNRTSELESMIDRGEFGPRSKDDVVTELETLKSNREMIVNEDLRFVNIPLKHWFFDQMQKNPQKYSKLFSSSILKRRESLTLEQFLESAQEEGYDIDVDVRDMVMSYQRQMSEIKAIDKIFDRATEDGIIKNADKLSNTEKESGNWTELPDKYGPWSGKYVATPFLDTFQARMGFNQNYSSVQHAFDTVFGTAKMLTFWNPVILPAYDIIQGIKAGTLISPNTPKNFAKAAKQVFGKGYDDNVLQAERQGTFSTPFNKGYDTFYKDVTDFKNTQDHNFMMAKALRIAQSTKDNGAVGILGSAKEMMSLMYYGSHDLAWKTDKVVRLTSRENLIERGYTPMEASQRAAKVHADYASIPKNTRKVLNKILYTPSFTISMSKLFAEEANSYRRVIMNSAQRGDIDKAASLGLMTAMMLARDYVMTERNDFERDEIFRRYTKEIENEEGEREELVVTHYGPDLEMWKTVNDVFSHDETATNIATKYLGNYETKTHPIYQLALQLATNQKSDYSKIYYNFDKESTKMRKTGVYAIKNTFRIMKAFASEDPERLREQDIAKKELGGFWDKVLTPITFKYVRSTEDQRKAGQMVNMEEKFRDDLIRALKRYESGEYTSEEYEDVIDSLRDEFDNSIDELEKPDGPTEATDEDKSIIESFKKEVLNRNNK